MSSFSFFRCACHERAYFNFSGVCIFNFSFVHRCPLLVFANKQDLINALPSDDISDALKLPTLRDRAWKIQV